MTSDHLAIVSAAVAVLSAGGSIASAIVSDLNGKRQHKAMIATMREGWIVRLREKMAWYIGTSARLYGSRTATPEDFRQFPIVRAEILMSLNPDEDEHAAFEKALIRVEDAIQVRLPEDEFEELNRQARLAGQKILKREWDRTREKK